MKATQEAGKPSTPLSDKAETASAEESITTKAVPAEELPDYWSGYDAGKGSGFRQGQRMTAKFFLRTLGCTALGAGVVWLWLGNQV